MDNLTESGGSSIYNRFDRIDTLKNPKRVSVRDPSDVVSLMMPRMRLLRWEFVVFLLLDSEFRILRSDIVSIGTRDSSAILTGEAILRGKNQDASSMIMVHNHPSGDPCPSDNDYETTKLVSQAGELSNIPLLDHIIIGNGTWVSMREIGVI